MVQDIAHYWALLASSVIAFVVLLFVLTRLVQDSARGRLAAAVDRLRLREKAARRAERRVRKAAGKLERLKRRAHATRPRVIEEAEGSLQDTQALRKVADDQVLIARHEVRQIITAEFPPGRQAALRRRLLPGEAPGGKPFTMAD